MNSTNNNATVFLTAKHNELSAIITSLATISLEWPEDYEAQWNGKGYLIELTNQGAERVSPDWVNMIWYLIDRT